eukprot:CAMPEP_0181057234 /NCGR_PEP_ID=MMETSP1070-20121207/20138_1 /TAXON_ID=265543 /ORGANISM="Minutocellus polymorphus, Strain NH13" /LENGTH=63 /DNA_ID=CAMNT_0023136627 /DNA_START=652 /DNA_END=840 /DNA_ORIENTATION=-
MYFDFHTSAGRAAAAVRRQNWTAPTVEEEEEVGRAECRAIFGNAVGGDCPTDGDWQSEGLPGC